MSSILRPPTGGTTTQDLTLDELNDRFWSIVQDELSSNSAELADDSEGLMRSFTNVGAQRFLEAAPEKQNLEEAARNLRKIIGEMVYVAAAQQQLAATAGGSTPRLIIDETVFFSTLSKAKRKGWTFWPFSW